MKLYSFSGCHYFLVYIYFMPTLWGFPFEKRSYSHQDLKYNTFGKKYIRTDINLNNHEKVKLFFNIKDPTREENHVDFVKSVIHLPQEITTQHTTGNVIKYKHSDTEEGLGLAEALTQDSEGTSTSTSMVLPIAGTLTVLFSMSILVAIFQCCCRKRQTSSSDNEHEESKESNEKLVKAEKDSGDQGGKKEDKLENKTQGSEDTLEKESTSIKSRIKALEGAIPSQPSPGPVRPLKKRPESNAFKALENQGIVYGVGKSPSRLSATPEDENQNATLSDESPAKPEKEPTKDDDDDMGGYKQPENPDVVIADVDESDEFSVIIRDTSVLRSHKRAPPPKNRNRSSAAIRRHRARETTTDLLFNDSGGDNSFLAIPDHLDGLSSNNSSVYIEETSSNNSKDTRKNRSPSSDRKIKQSETNKTKTSSMERNVQKVDNADSKKARSESSERKNKKDKSDDKREITPAILTTDHSNDNVIDISKQDVPPEVFSGGNIFMHIDPTVKKNNVSEEKKTATPPTRLRSSQLSVEERKEKAKSTPLLSSHEDLAKALSKLKSPSKENAGMKNRSSSDLSSKT